jgi:hypothetical protein
VENAAPLATGKEKWTVREVGDCVKLLAEESNRRMVHRRHQIDDELAGCTVHGGGENLKSAWLVGASVMRRRTPV